MKPPYDITSRILQYISSISEKIGEIKSAHLQTPPTELRKRNQIRTIQSSLEIEGNTLSVQQITDLINNKRVIAPKKDIMEVKNAIEVYNRLSEFKVYQLRSLCKAHGILMHGLVDNPGKLRTAAVGIVKGKQVAQLAPPGEMVRPLMNDLFDYLKSDDDLLLVKSCVFHYEFEFIHPFLDGNGRMGRLWQTMILKEYSPVFAFLPIESVIRNRQQAYYDALGKSDDQGNSTLFVEFMLRVIDEALEELLRVQPPSITTESRIQNFKDIMGNSLFNRQDYLRHNKDISSATASRDLKHAVENGILKKTGEKRLTKYRFKA